MTILAAIRREQRKLEKQAAKLQQQLDGLRSGRGQGSRQLCGQRTRPSTEESPIGGRKSETFGSREKTMGESESGSKESCELNRATGNVGHNSGASVGLPAASHASLGGLRG